MGIKVLIQAFEIVQHLWKCILQNAATDKGRLHVLLTECFIKMGMKMINTTQHPLKWKRSRPIEKRGKFHSAWMMIKVLVQVFELSVI